MKELLIQLENIMLARGWQRVNSQKLQRGANVLLRFLAKLDVSSKNVS